METRTSNLVSQVDDRGRIDLPLDNSQKLPINQIICGDALEELKKLPENSIDSIVTDPPYGIGFMGKEWDSFKPERIKKDSEYYNAKKIIKPEIRKSRLSMISSPAALAGSYDLSHNGMLKFQNWYCEVMKECLRVLKLGGHLLSFGGTRTYHRMACAIEDAGFEVRDMIEWVYGSGFPKSLDVSKQIDMKFFVEEFEKKHKRKPNKEERKKYREVIGKATNGAGNKQDYLPSERTKTEAGIFGGDKKEYNITIPATPEAKQWQGWGTALKPSHEPIVLCRKPLEKGLSVAENCLKWGTGGLNIDESRVACGTEHMRGSVGAKITESDWKNKSGFAKPFIATDSPLGRFPANLIHDNSPEVRECFPESKSTLDKTEINRGTSQSWFTGDHVDRVQRGDSGSASRFFKSIIYTAKASREERNRGLENLEPKQRDESRKEGNPGGDNPRNRGVKKVFNSHPTVKPLKLMEYLVRLVTPSKGICLDPFVGSGSTAIACKKLGFNFIGIEKEEEYCKIAEARLKSIQRSLL